MKKIIYIIFIILFSINSVLAQKGDHKTIESWITQNIVGPFKGGIGTLGW